MNDWRCLVEVIFILFFYYFKQVQLQAKFLSLKSLNVAKKVLQVRVVNMCTFKF